MCWRFNPNRRPHCLPGCAITRRPRVIPARHLCGVFLTHLLSPRPELNVCQAHHLSRRPLSSPSPPPPLPPAFPATSSSSFSSRPFEGGVGGGGGGGIGAGESPGPATGEPHSADRREEGATTVTDPPSRRSYGHYRGRSSSRDQSPHHAESTSVYGYPAGRVRLGSGGAASGWDSSGADAALRGKSDVSVGGGGGGWMGGVAWRGGGEARRLAKKVGALVRDPSPNSGLEGFQVEEARLRFWVRFCSGDERERR